MVLAVALLALTAFIAVAIIISAMGSRDGMRRQQESQATDQVARHAGVVLAGAYNALYGGEFNGFVLSKGAMDLEQTKVPGSKVIPNASLPADLRTVDASVPGIGQHTFGAPIDGAAGTGRFGFWQVYRVVAPTWGITKNGTVTVYVRAWTASSIAGQNATKAIIYRLTLRPEWFSDYQLLVDGKLGLSNTSHLTGRVHSNGAKSSFLDRWSDAIAGSWQVNLNVNGDGAATCSSTARITSASGPIQNAAGCVGSGGKVETREGEHVNILRANDAVQRMRSLFCPSGSLSGQVTQVWFRCVDGDATVVLGASTVNVSGSTVAVDSTVGGGRPLIVIASGDIIVSGKLGPRGRVLLAAAPQPGSSQYGDKGRPPSILVHANGPVGSNDDPTNRESAFGAVAAGSVVLDETMGCPSAFRGAVVATSGAMTSNPEWQQVYTNYGGNPCSGELKLQGSFSGHFSPWLTNVNADNEPVGFLNRRMSNLDSLYHNPPPMFPTTADWQVIRFARANLDELS